MFDFVAEAAIGGPRQGHVGGNALFWTAKRAFDIICALLLMPVLLFFACVLALLNPFLNRGSLFFVQDRMGLGCTKFRTIKFRSMTHAERIDRGHDDPVEVERITVLGRFIRKTRIDELPQILNVLKGDMSMIGPRPDYYEHAKVFLEQIPEYRLRHAVRPGITGLSQVSLGYIEGSEATRSKARMDLEYARNVGILLDTKIFLRTVGVIARMGGA